MLNVLRFIVFVLILLQTSSCKEILLKEDKVLIQEKNSYNLVRFHSLGENNVVVLSGKDPLMTRIKLCRITEFEFFRTLGSHPRGSAEIVYYENFKIDLTKDKFWIVCED